MATQTEGAENFDAGANEPDLVQPTEKVVKRRTPKVPEPEQYAPRDWKTVARQIRDLKEKGRSVPAIAEELDLSYILVNQVFLQSYKMTVQTIQLFEREEKRRGRREYPKK